MTFLIKTAIAVAVVYSLSPLTSGSDMPAVALRHLPQAAHAAQAAARLDASERAALAHLAGTLAQQALR